MIKNHLNDTKLSNDMFVFDSRIFDLSNKSHVVGEGSYVRIL